MAYHWERQELASHDPDQGSVEDLDWQLEHSGEPVVAALQAIVVELLPATQEWH